MQEVAVCFGARLMRGNRVQKVHSSAYRAFDSLTYPPLATLGVDVEWAYRNLLQVNFRQRNKPSSSSMACAIAYIVYDVYVICIL